MEKSRLLNMEEKRKLEKIIFQDIEKAVIDYRNKQQELENEIKDKLLAQPKAKELLERWNDNLDEKKILEQEAKAKGFYFDYDGYGENKNNVIRISDCENIPKEIIAIQEKTQTTADRLEKMKRNYTLKLFAGGAEAKEVFESLEKELKAIING